MPAKTAASFQGFPTATRKFLKELEANNNREWFAEHKQRYENDVVAPALAFITAMEPLIEGISPRFMAIPTKVGGSLMRIYKDTRFSKDKTPYKTNVGVHFRHERAKDVHAPGYYLHIDNTRCFLGVGLWRPCSEALAGIRKRIDEKPAEWVRVRDDKAQAKVWKLEGDSLKRAPKGYPMDHPLIEDLKRTDFIGVANLKVGDLTKPGLIKQVAGAYSKATPLMRFLCKSVGAAF